MITVGMIRAARAISREALLSDRVADHETAIRTWTPIVAAGVTLEVYTEARMCGNEPAQRISMHMQHRDRLNAN